MSSIYSNTMASESTRKPLRVLYVEDSPLDAELSLRELKKAGYGVTADVVATLTEFTERLKTGSYDIVLSDHNLGSWNGLEALEFLLEKDADLPFILVTGSLGEEAAVESIKKGADDYVLKDRLARLHVAVRRALEERASRAQRQRAEAHIARSEEKYRELFENANDFIYTMDLQGKLTSINLAGERILGCGRNELVGKNLIELTAPDKMDEFLEMIASKLGGKEVHFYERQITTKDGRKVTLEISNRLIRDANGVPEGIQGVARDVTERDLLQAQLQQSQKMEGIGRLAGGVAHDFNNHLGVIIGYSELLIEKLDTGSVAKKRAQTINETAQKAAALTKQLLAFSRRQVFESRIVDLNQVILEFGKMLRPLIGEDLEFVTALDSAIGKVRVDPSQMDQVLMNLAVNARDAMPEGGRLTIETKNAELDDAYVGGHIEVKPGLYVMLAVSDTGTGMNADTRSQIFEPFFTTKEKGKGTGLGLSMVYGIVKQSGGNIWVYSELGKGTTFKVYLPRVRVEAQMLQEPEVLGSIQRGTETILVAEDDGNLRDLTCEFLIDCGYNVLAAGDGAETLKISGQHAGVVHLLITDAVMPGMTGRELAVKLKGIRPDLKTLYVSGYTDDVVLRNGMCTADMEFLQKPFTRDQLVRKVRNVLGHE
jgi:two-component system, cell cycle sensor histidine kinase and response regulator CckA